MKCRAKYWLLFAGGALFGAWAVCEYFPLATVHLNLALYGYPFAELRADPPGARPRQADSYGLAYRRSVFTGGRYVGLIDRMGYFMPVDEHDGDAPPDSRWERALLGTYWFLRYAPWAAGVLCLASGVLFVWQRRGRNGEPSDGANAALGAPRSSS